MKIRILLSSNKIKPKFSNFFKTNKMISIKTKPKFYNFKKIKKSLKKKFYNYWIIKSLNSKLKKIGAFIKLIKIIFAKMSSPKNAEYVEKNFLIIYDFLIYKWFSEHWF